MYRLNSNLVEYLPDWFRQIIDYQAIMTAETDKFAALADEINTVADNYFFQTMDETAVAMWEHVFNIIPNPDTETLAFRRQRVLNRISTRPPFTLRFLYQKLDQIIGPGLWTVTVDYPNYTLYIESSVENQQWATEVSYTINGIKPAHIVYINRPLVSDALGLGHSLSLAEIVWNYKLGSWGLGETPFSSAQEKGVVTIPKNSIQTQLLTDTATFVIGDVAAAKINGSVNITTLTKYTEGNTACIEYTVKPSDTSAVTSLALLDSTGNVLVSSPVYVAIADNTIFLHKIKVKEAAE